MDSKRRNRIAQWAFDTRPLLGRFHLWLEDVDVRPVRRTLDEGFSFVGGALEKSFVVCTAVTALGTRLFGSYGEGQGRTKWELDRVKKDADAVSAYAMSEGLWYLTRALPENHAVMVSLGEGLMPKVGESPEMGSNPLLGFGRVYARPQVAIFVDACVRKLINEPEYEWGEFWEELRSAGITLWGAAIDTLENTTRFASGAETGPMSVLHLFDQPLEVSRPYEGYMGVLALPRRVVDRAAEHSRLLHYRSPRRLILDAVLAAYPGVVPSRVHVWTLGGDSRRARIGSLWSEWQELGVHLVEDDWRCPSGGRAFRESGTYAPTYCVGEHEDERGNTHVVLLDGYAASAEAIQAASLDPVLDARTSLCVFSSRFQIPWNREPEVMYLDPDAPEFEAHLSALLKAGGGDAGVEATKASAAEYAAAIRDARMAGMPLDLHVARVDDFFPTKRWRVLAVSSPMLPDPYTGMQGVEEVGADTYRTTTRAATRSGIIDVDLTFRLMQPFTESKLVFSPLLDRFASGVDWETRAVKISDSGRIRNELQTLVSGALEHLGDRSIRVHFDRIEEAVLPAGKRKRIQEVLHWYKRHHPVWFRWLELS